MKVKFLLNYTFLKGNGFTFGHKKKYDIYQDGRFISVDAPIGEPAVFYKQGSDIGEKFLKNLIRMDVINNH